MSAGKRDSLIGVLVKVAIGLVIAYAGWQVHNSWHPEMITKLNEQGIPLDPGKTVSFVGMFIALFPLIKFFFLNDLGLAINTRTTELEHTFSEAENLRSEMEQMKTEYEQRLSSTEAAAREQIQGSIREAQAMRDKLLVEASARADELVAKAEEEISQERLRLASELRSEVVELTLQATEKLIGDNMDSDRNRKLVAEFLDKVEVSG